MSVKYFVILSVILSCQFLNGAAEEGKRENLLPNSSWIGYWAGEAMRPDFKDNIMRSCLAMEELVVRQKSKEPEEIVNDLVKRYCIVDGVVNGIRVDQLATIYRWLAITGLFPPINNPAEELDFLILFLDQNSLYSR